MCKMLELTTITIYSMEQNTIHKIYTYREKGVNTR